MVVLSIHSYHHQHLCRSKKLLKTASTLCLNASPATVNANGILVNLKSAILGIKCCRKCNSFIKFNMVVAPAEVYNGKHFSLWKLVEYIIKGYIVERFSAYGFMQVGGAQTNVWVGFAMLVKLFVYWLWQNSWSMEWHGQLAWIWLLLAFLLIAACWCPVYIESFWMVHLDLPQCSMVHPGTCISLENNLWTISSGYPVWYVQPDYLYQIVPVCEVMVYCQFSYWWYALYICHLAHYEFSTTR